MKMTTINGRWDLLLPDHRAARPEWTTPPYWEPERIGAMFDTIRPGDLVFDIGAEEGDMPGLWAAWGADVVLVEPNPKVWPNIRAVFEANDLTARARGMYVGFAGDTPRERPEWDAEHVQLWRSDQQWPACAYGPIIGDHGFLVLPERPDCPTTTIDQLAAEHGAPNVITLDVEGAELTVLRGADLTLRTARPIVFASVHIDLPWIDEKYPGDTGAAVAAFMAERGYTDTHLATDHEEHHVYLPA